MNELQKVLRAAECIRAKMPFAPEIVLTLGSGLGDFAEEVDVVCEIGEGEIDGFVTSTVPGHEGKLIFGMLEGKKVALMKGRVHLYEGYDAQDAVRPLRALKLCGASTLFLTNAAGGVNFSFNAGDLMLIRDHISPFVPSPLRGENLSEFGVRFPDMSCVYSKHLCDKVLEAAKNTGVKLQQGVYLQFPGPQYETPAEIRMFRTLGADAVGMSTAVEAIAARHAGMEVVGISCISNLACGMTDKPLSHEEVQEAATAAKGRFTTLVRESIRLF